MTKIKILVLPSNSSYDSVKKRLIEPHIDLEQLYGNEYEVEIDNNPNINDIEYFKKFNLIIFDRNIGSSYSKCKDLMLIIKKDRGVNNTQFIMNLDSYWMVDKNNPYFETFKRNDISSLFLQNIRNSDYIITPNKALKFKASNVTNKEKVEMILSYPHKNKKKERVINDKIKFGLVVDEFYKNNLSLLKDVFSKLNQKDLSKSQFILTNFDTSGTYNEYNPITGLTTERIMKPELSLSVECEKLITNNYKICSKEYAEFLKKYIPNEDYNGDLTKEPYIREWKKNSWNFDILLFPLLNNTYNVYTTNILMKILCHENGVVMLSNIIDSSNPFDDIIKKGNNSKQWLKEMRLLIEKPKETFNILKNNQEVFFTNLAGYYSEENDKVSCYDLKEKVLNERYNLYNNLINQKNKRKC